MSTKVREVRTPVVRDTCRVLLDEGWDQKANSDGGYELAGRLELLAADGNAVARAVLTRWTIESGTRAWKAFLNDEAPRIIVSHAGQVIGTSGRRAVQIRDEDGVPTGGYQQKLITFMDWDEVDEALRSEAARINRLRANVWVLRQLVRYHEQCPSAATPRDACIALGIDPDSLVIEVSA